MGASGKGKVGGLMFFYRGTRMEPEVSVVERGMACRVQKRSHSFWQRRELLLSKMTWRGMAVCFCAGGKMLSVTIRQPDKSEAGWLRSMICNVSCLVSSRFEAKRMSEFVNPALRGIGTKSFART